MESFDTDGISASCGRKKSTSMQPSPLGFMAKTFQQIALFPNRLFVMLVHKKKKKEKKLLNKIFNPLFPIFPLNLYPVQLSCRSTGK